mmetsp:Transcript_150384/g.288014  ORF Transcript_150384/g.288014 Transcript_150384/m.288014 type:complete len:452 (+) Transcript_150384:116-1471(+)
MHSGQYGAEHPPPPPGEPPPPPGLPVPPPVDVPSGGPAQEFVSANSADKQVGVESNNISGHDPTRLVIKNTFLDLDRDSDDDSLDLDKMTMNHRKSDSGVTYGRQKSENSPKGRSGWFETINPAPSQDATPASSSQPKNPNANRFQMYSEESQYAYDAYDAYNRGGSSSSIMSPENPMARQDQQMGGFGDRFGCMGIEEAGSRVAPPIDPYGEMAATYGTQRQPHGVASAYGQPWWPYMPPYLQQTSPYMATQAPPFMPQMSSYNPMPNYEHVNQPPPPAGKGNGKGAGGKAGGKAGGHTRTTIMLRNLPPEYTRDMMIELLDKEGFAGLYDFVYMPMNLRTKESFGYVFVDLVSPVVADQCRSRFQGFSKWSIPSEKVCDVLWSDEQQGLSANIERYRNSPVMHESVPEDCKPVVFANGYRMQFPPATKRLREPRIRRAVPKEKEEDAKQ